MKTYLLVFFSTVVVVVVSAVCQSTVGYTALPQAATSYKLLHRLMRETKLKDVNKEIDRHLLMEIMDCEKTLKEPMSKKVRSMFVANAFEDGECTLFTLCNAGTILSKAKVGDLGHKANKCFDRLHRNLASYTKPTDCSNLRPQSEIQLDQLLSEIKSCAQKRFK